ncbi:hypothetical protein [Phenylobacterium sp.]|jgi:hypothetical protein|uniref:hypothetical protein n=1 Tax=Phenylobacterium sp. TaxID=1871053 RepID=UPI002E2F1FF5|nr:hypothetical protein [Phenylobacterium sp.]HEX3364332.1 hypothetical protein [Phenylobacterium sp.]
MMRRFAILALAAAAALSGCALPADRPRMTWGVTATREEGAKLVLGVAATDEVRLMMTCQPRSGAVTVTIVGRSGDGAVAEIHSGKIWNRYTGAGHADDEFPGAMDIDFHLDAADPVLTHIADTGEIMVILTGRRLILPNAFAPAHDFLAICRR